MARARNEGPRPWGLRLPPPPGAARASSWRPEVSTAAAGAEAGRGPRRELSFVSLSLSAAAAVPAWPQGPERAADRLAGFPSSRRGCWARVACAVVSPSATAREVAAADGWVPGNGVGPRTLPRGDT